jgi:hypothetical protein
MVSTNGLLDSDFSEKYIITLFNLHCTVFIVDVVLFLLVNECCLHCLANG